MSCPVCLRAEDSGRCAPFVLCPKANRARHCALISSSDGSEIFLYDLCRCAPLVISENFTSVQRQYNCDSPLCLPPCVSYGIVVCIVVWHSTAVCVLHCTVLHHTSLPSLEKYDPPERKDPGRKQGSLPPWAADVWGLGCLVWEVGP